MEIKFVQQPELFMCGHACLSMVSGIDIKEIVEFTGRVPLSKEALTYTMFHFGIHHNWQSVSRLFNDRLYIVTVPSLNCIGGMHYIVVNCVGGKLYILDPIEGASGMKHYTNNNFISWAEPVEIFFISNEDMK